MNYFIQVEGESHGPLTEEQIRSRLSDTSLKKSDLMRREDGAEWMPLSSLAEFTDGGQRLPPLSNPMAVASLVLGLVSVWLFFSFLRDRSAPLFWITSIPAVVLGHLALRKIGTNFRDVKGGSVAKCGLWLGYLMSFAFPVAAALAIPTFSKIAERSPQTRAISNCRQIITTLRIYSSDATGIYPDHDVPQARSSNEVFHLLFVTGVADNEQIFGSPVSPFQPDGNIGKGPDYLEALTPGENHWAMTKGLDDSAAGSYPLVYENPAEATWPPKWNADLADQPKPGRAWKGGKIIIGMNDSSVSMQKLESDKGDRVGLKLSHDDKDLFTQNERALEILNVAR